MKRRKTLFLKIIILLLTINFAAVTSTLFLLKTTNIIDLIIWLLAAILGIIICVAYKNDSFGEKFLRIAWLLLIILGISLLIYITDGYISVKQHQLLPYVWKLFYYGYAHAVYFFICGIAIKIILATRRNTNLN